jgi:hypothetical protein
MDRVAENETDLRWLTEAFDQKSTFAAFDVAMRWAEFDQYGSEQAACKALRRRSPGLTALDYVETLQKAVRILEAAHLCLKPHATELKGKQGLTDLQWVSLAGELEVACPGFEHSWYALAVWWVWYTDYHSHR